MFIGWHAHIAFIGNDSKKLIDAAPPNRCDNAEFGKMRPDRMSTELTNVKQPVLNPASPNDADYEQAVSHIIGRLAKERNGLQNAGIAIPETDGWFPPSMPRRGCEDC